MIDDKLVRYPDMISCMRKGNAEILYQDADGILMLDQASGYAYAMCESKSCANVIFACAKASVTDLIIHGSCLREELANQPWLKAEEPYYCAVYMEETMITQPTPASVTLRQLDASMIPEVCQLYSFRELAIPSYISERIAEGMIGAFSQGEIVGFIGIHDSGSIGMLEVAAKARRKGIARSLVCACIQQQLTKGNIPFAEIFEHNEASKKLAEQVGMIISEEPTLWCTRVNHPDLMNSVM